MHGGELVATRFPGRHRVGGGEFATTFEECMAWLEIGQVDVIQADIARCGGLTEMRRVMIGAR